MASDQDATAGRARALSSSDLMSLEQYARERQAFRARVLEHKRARTVAVGPNVIWVFEDRLTIQYQVQEMLRIERIFEPEGIQDELDAYNPLIPDGGNLKATMMIEYPDPEERLAALAALRGVERACSLEADGAVPVVAIADEDLERATEEKTSAVHWLRFELTTDARDAIRRGKPITARVDHPHYRHAARLSAATVESLARDLD